MRKEYLNNSIQLVLPVQEPHIHRAVVDMLDSECGGCTSWVGCGEWVTPDEGRKPEEVIVYESSAEESPAYLADEIASYLLEVTKEEAIFIKVNGITIIYHRS